MKNYENIIELAKELNSDLSAGLTDEKLLKNREKYGANKFSYINIDDNKKIFLNGFKSPVTAVLIIAAVTSLCCGFLYNNIPLSVMSLINFSIIFLNVLVSYEIKKYKKKPYNIIENFKFNDILTTRNGNKFKIPYEKVVVGEILEFQKGDIVCADCRIFEMSDLILSEYKAFGDSLKKTKSINQKMFNNNVNQNDNIIYCGSEIISGRCKGIAIAVGKKTKLNDTVEESNKIKSASFLFEEKIKSYFKNQSIFGIVGYFIVSILSFIFTKDTAYALNDGLVFILSAVPICTTVVFSLILAQGFNKALENNVEISEPSTLYSLSRIDTLCGSEDIFFPNLSFKISSLWTNTIVEKTDSDLNSTTIDMLKIAALLTKNSNYTKNQLKYIKAIDNVLIEKGIDKNNFINDAILINFQTENNVIIAEYKFNDRILQVKFGEFSEIFPMCSDYDLDSEIIYDMENTDYNKIMAIAIKDLSLENAKIESEFIENDLTLCGFLIYENTVLQGQSILIDKIKKEGLTPIIITENDLIISEITEKMNMINGYDLMKISDAALPKMISQYNLFTNINLKAKKRIINALKLDGKNICFVTDNSADIPALCESDVGVIFNQNTNTASKKAANIVVTNNKIESLINLINHTEKIKINFITVMRFIMSVTISLLLINFTGRSFLGKEIFTAQHLMWINGILLLFCTLIIGMNYNFSYSSGRNEAVKIGKYILISIIISIFTFCCFGILKMFFSFKIAAIITNIIYAFIILIYCLILSYKKSK